MARSPSSSMSDAARSRWNRSSRGCASMAGRRGDCASWQPARFSSCNRGCSQSMTQTPRGRRTYSRCAAARAQTGLTIPRPTRRPPERAPSLHHRALRPTRHGAADTPDGAPDGAARAEGAEASRVQPQAAPQRPERQRVKLPFWLLGLLGTAAFLGLGVLVLAATLAPKKAAPAPDRAQLESALRRIASSVGEDVTVERLPTGRFKLSGHVANRTQRMSLTREARAADPAALIHVSADDDLEALAREALALFPGSGAEFGGVQRGRLTLRGHVSEGSAARSDRRGDARRGAGLGRGRRPDHGRRRRTQCAARAAHRRRACRADHGGARSWRRHAADRRRLAR